MNVKNYRNEKLHHNTLHFQLFVILFNLLEIINLC
jgi:hypothetical protein